MNDDFNFNYGYLFEEELRDQIKKEGILKTVSAGHTLIEIGDYITSMPLILSGAVKVMREDENGDELILYFIEKGDTCAMTITCCMGQKKSEIRAVAETEATLIMVPIQKVGEWMYKYRSWQNFILQSYHDKMQEMLEAIDTIAFLNMDERILKYLKDKAMVNHNDLIQVTHQQIANDLHTSRVVISRLLKALENKGKINLQRNYIQLNEL